ncbi:MAG: branched-chain amino acid ABC transporter permease [Actinobacteria bacterium]|nr:branched-chain amino acid ABC transporter permease [Actinomycetota bacterium]
MTLTERPQKRYGSIVVGILVLSVIILVIGWLESAQPGGLNIAALTGGVVTFDTMVRIGILTTAVVGLNLLMGYAGQVSLGQVAFIGLGAYFSAVLTTRPSLIGASGLSGHWWWPWLLMLVGTVFTGGLAYLVGRPILRLRGHYLAMATLGLGVMVNILFRENLGFAVDKVNITGGSDGIYGIPRLSIGSWDIWPIERYYYLVWLVAIVGILLALNMVKSRSGRALRALHCSELASETLGVDTARYKVRALVLSAMYASIAGSLYAHFRVAVSPKPFDFGASLELVVMAAVGGMASVWGAPFGVAAVVILRDLLRTHLSLVIDAVGGAYEVVAFGIILILIMIFMPEGVVARTKEVVRRWSG